MPRPLRRTASVLIVVLVACLFAFPQEIRFAGIADTHAEAGKAVFRIRSED